jgi:SPOR domain
MSDSIFNRPRRQIEPRLPDEHGRDFADQSYTPDQGAAVRRDPGTDALSELARLISDPHAIPGRLSDAPGGRLGDVSRAASSPTAAAHAPFTRTPAREPAQSQDRPSEDRSSDDWSRRSSVDRGVRRDSDFSRPRAAVQPTEADTGHSEPPHESFDFLQLPDRDDYAVAPRHALAEGGDYDLGDHREGSPAPRRQPAYGRQDEEFADEYSEDEYGQDADREYEGEEEPEGAESGAKRRSTTKVAIAVLGLAVFGSAAAFGYRTVFKAAPSGPTPIIRADNSPTKVTPVGTGVNARPANGPFADRSGEQLVRRDEDPVDVASTYRSGASDAGTAGFPSPAIVPATVGPGPSGDPKRVRTVPIRVDQGPPSDRTAPSDRTSRAVSPPQSEPPLSAPTYQSPVPAPTRQAAVSPPPQSQPPLSTPAYQPPVPTRQAAVSPPPYTPPSTAPYTSQPAGEGRVSVATAPEAAASRAVEAGGFVVQLSAQRSEPEAQAAFRTLQAKYAVLSGRDPLIRRKDLGEKGIFFAAQVGPFGVKGDADQLCETLKAAGGACFVQRN